MPRSVKSASAIRPILSEHGAHNGLEPLPVRQRGVTPASKRSCVWPGVCWCLGICPHGIRGPLAKTGTNPTGKPSSNRHNGALLAPGRRDPVEHLFEHPVTRQRAPGGFDEHVADTTGALAAHMAAPHRGPRRIRAGCQPRRAEQRPLIGKAGPVAQLGRSGPGDHLANARDAPIHFFDCLLRLGLVTQQAAHLDELARGKAPLLGQQRETHAELRGQRPRGNLP